MSRRKQSKPRQIKRSPGDLDGGEDNALDGLSLSGEEGGASDQEDSAEGDASSPSSSTVLLEDSRSLELRRGTDVEEEEGGEPGSEPGSREEQEEAAREEETLHWNLPDQLDLRGDGDERRVEAAGDLQPGTRWGPYPGTVQSEARAAEEEEPENSKAAVVCEDPDCWITLLPLTSDVSASNCTIVSRGGALFCELSRELSAGQALLASLPPPPGSSCSPPLSLSQPAPEEEQLYPAALRPDIQLLPQQAGMAAILATAVVNKDIFPCKDCGIWYRSERNLQAHLLYYCASRQKPPSAAASPPQDKAKEPHPHERVCPFPQCNKSCPSASSLEIHMRTHSGERPFVCLICLSAFTTKANCERHLKVHTDTLKGACHGCGFVSTTRDILYSHLVTSHMVCQPGSHAEVVSPGPAKPAAPTGLRPGDSGVVLRCQVCGHNADSPSQLQQHVRTHLELRVPGRRSPAPRQNAPPPPERRPPAGAPRPGSNGCSPGRGAAAAPGIKEEPRSDDEGERRRAEAASNGEEQAEGGASSPGPGGAGSSGGSSASPASPLPPTVKAEPTSPTPGSSPAHAGGAGTLLPGGAIFLPQYLFSPEAAILPQASEILAKMSEMVHSRLKQGQPRPQGSPTAFFPSAAAPTATATPPQAGATCFECDITFNNINNFYAHKRLYCSSRHHGDAAAAAARDAAPLSASPQGAAASRAASASPSDSDPPAGGVAAEPQRLVEVKTETPAARDGVSSSSEGEGGGGGGGGGGSQSPAPSVEELEDDPNRTFCQACNIRFSRHDNYTVHKRFYCASRHDPSNQRTTHAAKASAAAAATAFLPQPIRTRKRKKMYEIHMARTEALAAAAAAATAPAPSALGLPAKQEGSPSGGRSSSPEGDGPIDLSKRPRLREAGQRAAGGGALPLSDYHKCSACSISFNSIENYLAHKTYYCPAPTLLPHTLEQLQRLQRPASPPGRAPPEQPAPAEAGARRRGASASPEASPPPGAPQGLCPYCPHRRISCDLVEHFRSSHGLVVPVQTPQEPLARPSSAASASPCRSPRDGATAPPSSASSSSSSSSSSSRPLPEGQLGGINGQAPAGSGPASPASPLLNGNPRDGSPSSSPQAPPTLTLSPVPENLRESLAPAPSPQPAIKAGVVAAAPGSGRFCRLCNIRFSSLSTFIAHKKYYCSSHSAEHVK